MPDTLTLGLRFTRRDVDPLRKLSEQLRSLQPANVDLSLYDKALASVELNEPLVVHCSDREEIERMAHGFTLLGIDRPVIEELNG